MVSFAAIAGTTLHRHQAIPVALSVWLANQVYGYTLRQYPLSFESFDWGVIMGLGTLAVVMIARTQWKFSHNPWMNQSLWLAIAFLGGFGIYQSSIFFVSQWLGIHGLTFPVLVQIFLRDAFWVIGLFSLHSGLVLRYLRLLRL